MVSTGRDVNWETAWAPVYIAMVNMYFAQLLHFVLLHHCPAATASLDRFWAAVTVRKEKRDVLMNM